MSQSNGAMMSVNTKYIELISALAVLVGLIFVGLELRQNTVAVSASTYDRLAESSVDYLYLISDNEEVASLMTRVFKGETSAAFTSVENNRIWAVEIAVLIHLENSYRQYQAGVVGPDIFESYGWNDALLWSPHFLEGWPEQFQGFVDDEFVNFLTEHIEMKSTTSESRK